MFKLVYLTWFLESEAKKKLDGAHDAILTSNAELPLGRLKACIENKRPKKQKKKRRRTSIL